MHKRNPQEHPCRPPRPWVGVGRSLPHKRGLAAVAPGLPFEASPTATIVADQHLHIIAANPAYEQLSGLGPSEWFGTVPCVRGPHGEAVQQLIGRGCGNLVQDCVVTVCRRDGKECRAWMSWRRVNGAGAAGQLHIATFTELARWDRDYERWRHLARHDGLTGLPNRDHLEAELERALARAARRAHRLALLFIDLDAFKPVNDEFGHAAGDRVLARVGMRMRDALRAEDFVARFGGDEFVVLLEAPRHAADAAAVARTVLAALGHERAHPDAKGPPITASIGIALYPDDALDAAGLLQVADAAMYRAKRAGGNAVGVGRAEPGAPLLPRQTA